MKLMFVDVKKAHLNAACDEEEWVELPQECWRWGRYAKLRRWLYGMRKAASGWEEDYAGRLEKVGYKRGIAAPTVFWNKDAEVRVVVHGDDFTFMGTDEQLDVAQDLMKKWYEVKVRGRLGDGVGDCQEITILGRTLRWTEDGLELEGTASTGGRS